MGFSQASLLKYYPKGSAEINLTGGFLDSVEYWLEEDFVIM